MTPLATTDIAPYSLFLGREIRARQNLLAHQLESNIVKKQVRQKFN